MSSGIYILQSILFPNRQYVGSCVDFNLRWMVHQSTLIAKKHHNAKLQNHVNKYGLSDILFLHLETCSRENLLIREQYYIDTLKPHFNINPIAGSRLGSRHSARTKLQFFRAGKKRNIHSRVSSLRGRFM